MDGEACQVSAMEMRAKTLMEVKNDLQGRLEELVWGVVGCILLFLI